MGLLQQAGLGELGEKKAHIGTDISKVVLKYLTHVVMTNHSILP